MACYDNIIGLSRADCPCIDTAPGEGFDTSLSGLYMADLTPLDNLEGLEECGVGSVWDMLGKSRDEAVKIFVADTNAMLMNTFSSRRENFKGQIGEAVGRETLETSNTYAGIRLAFNPMRGGRIKITKIGTLFSGAGTLTLKIHNALNVQVWTGDVTISNGWTLNTLETAITLPTFVEFSNTHEYFLTYTYNPSNKPKLNKINCGCGGFVPWYDLSNPMWKNQHSGGRAWAGWMMCGGWTGNTLTDFDQATGNDGTIMNGLALQIELGCDIGQVLCNGTLDFETDPFAMSIAHAIRYKADSIMLQKLLGSTDLTRSNTINREYYKERRGEMTGRYNKMIDYITQSASLQNIDCLTCKDPHGMIVKPVLT